MGRLLIALFWLFSLPTTLCFGAQSNEIAAGEELPVVVQPEPPLIQVFVKTLHQRTLTIDIGPESTVAKLKSKIHDKKGTPVDQMLLMHNGKPLEDERAITYYGVKQFGTVNLLTKLAGD